MQESIKKLQEARENLGESISFLKKGDFNALLHYFQKEHAAAFLIDETKEINKKFAGMLNEKWLSFGFKTNEQFDLFYKEEKIGKVNPKEKEVIITFLSSEKEKTTTKMLQVLEAKKKELFERQTDLNVFIKENEKKMKTGSKKILVEKFKESLYNIPLWVEKVNEEIKKVEKEKEELQNFDVQLEKLKKESKSFGFLVK